MFKIAQNKMVYISETLRNEEVPKQMVTPRIGGKRKKKRIPQGRWTDEVEEDLKIQ